MNSRVYTESGLTINQEKALESEKKPAKKPVVQDWERVKCLKCAKTYASYATLYTHVTKKEECKTHYQIKRKIEKLEQDLKLEKKEKKESAKNQQKSDHQEIRQARVCAFTEKMKKEFKIAVNQVKAAGHGASVENFNTTRKVLDYKNRDKLIALYVFESEDEKFQFAILLRNLGITSGNGSQQDRQRS